MFLSFLFKIRAVNIVNIKQMLHEVNTMVGKLKPIAGLYHAGKFQTQTVCKPSIDRQYLVFFFNSRWLYRRLWWW